MEDMKTSASAVVGASEDSSVICSCCGARRRGGRAASWRAMGDKKDRKATFFFHPLEQSARLVCPMAGERSRPAARSSVLTQLCRYFSEMCNRPPNQSKRLTQ